MFGDPSPEVIEAIAAARRGDALKSREQLEREKKEREVKGKLVPTTQQQSHSVHVRVQVLLIVLPRQW